MEITFITSDEYPGRPGRQVSEVSLAIDALVTDTGLKTPCVWKHTGSHCGGITAAHVRAKRKGYTVRGSCQDGVLYIIKRST